MYAHGILGLSDASSRVANENDRLCANCRNEVGHSAKPYIHIYIALAVFGILSYCT